MEVSQAPPSYPPNLLPTPTPWRDFIPQDT